MEALEQRFLIYDPAEVARSGVFVTLDRDDSLPVYRGFVRLEDDPRKEAAAEDDDSSDAMGQGADIGESGWRPSTSSTTCTVITSDDQLIGAEPSEEEDDGALKRNGPIATACRG